MAFASEALDFVREVVGPSLAGQKKKEQFDDEDPAREARLEERYYKELNFNFWNQLVSLYREGDPEALEDKLRKMLESKSGDVEEFKKSVDVLVKWIELPDLGTIANSMFK